MAHRDPEASLRTRVSQARSRPPEPEGPGPARRRGRNQRLETVTARCANSPGVRRRRPHKLRRRPAHAAAVPVTRVTT